VKESDWAALEAGKVHNMDSKKPDRRTLRTKKALCEALAQLLTTKELHRITVQEIADKADVNRVTFYKHYLDVYDLYEKLEKEVITEIELVILDGERNPEYMKSLIDYIDENRIYFSMIMSPYCTGTIRHKIGKMFDGTYLTICKERYNMIRKDTEFEYLCHYHVSGCLSVLEKWENAGYDQPKDLIVKGINELEKRFRMFCDSKYGNRLVR
jgi:AcrR family transcriptional regulator